MKRFLILSLIEDWLSGLGSNLECSVWSRILQGKLTSLALFRIVGNSDSQSNILADDCESLKNSQVQNKNNVIK